MENKLVSVIIPLYNASPYIEETIQSVLNQTYNTIEIIVVDDHSNDNSYKIVENIKSNKIKLFKNKGKGASAARNTGFHYSSGQFIQYLDADDLLSPNKIYLQLKALQNNNETTIASCGWVRFYNDYKGLSIKSQPLNKSYSDPVNWLIDSWSGKGMGIISMWLTPRNLIKKAGIWNEDLSTNDDGEFFCRVLINSTSILYTENVIVYYRIGNPFSISERKLTNETGASLLKSYKLYEVHLKKHIENEKLKKAIATNYLNFIYLYDSTAPLLTQKAWEYFNQLNIETNIQIGGKAFKFIAKKIGFSKALFFKRIIYKIKKYGV